LPSRQFHEHEPFNALDQALWLPNGLFLASPHYARGMRFM
jgi:hypothetical protein